MYLQFNNSRYFYATNLQGDVLAILNSSGSAVVSYTYDAWGNILSTTGSMASTLGQINPLRYRGYVYNEEFGLYYLQSRYYNAGLGRFNAPDAFASTGQGLLGNNMYAYCNNNPTNGVDPTGESPLMVLLFAAAGAAINVATSYIGTLVTGQTYSLPDGIAAAVAGALCAFGPTGAILAGLVSGLYSAFMSHQNGAEWWGALLTGLTSGVFTAAGIGNLAGIEQTLSNLGIQAFIDLVFCTGYNSMSSAVYNAVTPDLPSQDEAISTSPSNGLPQKSFSAFGGSSFVGGQWKTPTTRLQIQAY